MKIFTIIVFGFSLVRTITPIATKQQKTLISFIAQIIVILLTLIAYIWFLNQIIN